MIPLWILWGYALQSSRVACIYQLPFCASFCPLLFVNFFFGVQGIRSYLIRSKVSYFDVFIWKFLFCKASSYVPTCIPCFLLMKSRCDEHTAIMSYFHLTTFSQKMNCIIESWLRIYRLQRVQQHWDDALPFFFRSYVRLTSYDFVQNHLVAYSISIYSQRTRPTHIFTMAPTHFSLQNDLWCVFGACLMPLCILLHRSRCTSVCT